MTRLVHGRISVWDAAGSLKRPKAGSCDPAESLCSRSALSPKISTRLFPPEANAPAACLQGTTSNPRTKRERLQAACGGAELLRCVRVQAVTHTDVARIRQHGSQAWCRGPAPSFQHPAEGKATNLTKGPAWAAEGRSVAGVPGFIAKCSGRSRSFPRLSTRLLPSRATGVPQPGESAAPYHFRWFGGARCPLRGARRA